MVKVLTNLFRFDVPVVFFVLVVEALFNLVKIFIKFDFLL